MPSTPKSNVEWTTEEGQLLENLTDNALAAGFSAASAHREFMKRTNDRHSIHGVTKRWQDIKKKREEAQKTSYITSPTPTQAPQAQINPPAPPPWTTVEDEMLASLPENPEDSDYYTLAKALNRLPSDIRRRANMLSVKNADVVPTSKGDNKVIPAAQVDKGLILQQITSLINILQQAEAAKEPVVTYHDAELKNLEMMIIQALNEGQNLGGAVQDGKITEGL